MSIHSFFFLSISKLVNLSYNRKKNCVYKVYIIILIDPTRESDENSNTIRALSLPSCSPSASSSSFSHSPFLSASLAWRETQKTYLVSELMIICTTGSYNMQPQ